MSAFIQTPKDGLIDGTNNTKESSGGLMLPLPLNLIALIISFLDQPSDLARTCRTCRVFHYMTLPSLYANVSLRSYDYIRYSQHDGRPEGCGMASPFSMGLSGLVSRNVAGYVRSFRLQGEWKEHELQEHSKAGRVTDSSMMLCSLVRVAVEKMAVLESFSWELDTKMLPTVWQGLMLKPTLTHLIIKSPSSRHPRPIALVPPIPNLKSLKVYDIDPLCYADDFSLLFLGAKRLEELKFIWNPRMRETREPSISLNAYFGKMMAADQRLPVRRLFIKNLYTVSDEKICRSLLTAAAMEEVTFINSVSGSGDDADTVFFDRSHRIQDHPKMFNLKMLRIDKVSRQQVQYLENLHGLERLYLVGSHKVMNNTPRTDTTPLPNSPVSSSNSPCSDSTAAVLKDEYLDVITKNHGKTLRHLLLMPHWRLSSDDIARVVRQCPNLEQLGIGVDFDDFVNLRLLIPFLSKLKAFRILDNPDDPLFADKMREIDRQGGHQQKIGAETQNPEWKIQWIGFGGDLLYEIGELELQASPEDSNKKIYRRPVIKRPFNEAQHVEIFGLDSLDV